MILSNLQKYILRHGLESRNYRVGKNVLLEFYAKQKNPPSSEDQLSSITKSVERLIKRSLLKGAGIKTSEKWFIKEVILTPQGIRQAKELLGRQQQIPFKKSLHKK